MSCALTIRNVGGLRGKHDFVFKRGALNLVKAANSAGKSSLVRALISALGMTEISLTDDFFSEEARQLGLKADPRNPTEGFVNVHAGVAEVSLRYDDNQFSYRVKSTGEVVETPTEGDPRFLVAGVLSNSSRIMRQLNGLDVDYEPDEFHWAVDRLSYAQGYNVISDLIKVYLEDARNLRHTARESLKQLKDLTSEFTRLERKLAKVTKQHGDLSASLKSVEAKEILQRREKLLKEIEQKNASLGKWDAERGALGRDRDSTKKLIESSTQEQKKIQRDLEGLDVEKIKEDARKERRVLDDEVSELVGQRNRLDGQLSLLTEARQGLKDVKAGESLTCPLCEVGELHVVDLGHRIGSLSKEREELTSKIRDGSLGKERLRKRENRADEERSTILRKKREIAQRLHDLRSSLDYTETELEGLISNIGKYEADIAQAEKTLKEVEVGEEQTELVEKLETLEQERVGLMTDMRFITAKMGQSSIAVGDHPLPPDQASDLLTSWIEELKWMSEYVEGEVTKQRRKAADVFNANVTDLLEGLGFREFRTVKVDDRFRLYVERYDQKLKDYVPQEVKTLSTSEKLSVALILQLALKETYVPRIPFFIVDDILEDFDEDRARKVMDYLSEKGESEGIWVIATKLDPSLEQPEISSWT